jgi:hypothetical protein
MICWNFRVRAKQLFDALDNDRNGSVTLDEFIDGNIIYNFSFFAEPDPYRDAAPIPALVVNLRAYLKKLIFFSVQLTAIQLL